MTISQIIKTELMINPINRKKQKTMQMASVVKVNVAKASAVQHSVSNNA